uniref:Queuosine 5'-phosphate N-glycosylase/hydrolase n=1 Tax=Clastoptera arizonana TaxID=38151 RepID=A0A1B6C8Q7_9HEMI
MHLLPKESGSLISKTSTNVFINKDGVLKLSEQIANKLLSEEALNFSYSSSDCHPKPSKDAIDWIFVVDTLNFCFWSDIGKSWEVTWNDKVYTGYFALCAAINRALQEGIHVTNPKVYSQLSIKDLHHILRGDNEILPLLMEERLNSLHEVGSILLNKYEGSFVNCVESCNKSAQNLLQLIVTEFPCFRDEATYKGQRVSFYKRAQILIGDLWSLFNGKAYGEFHDFETLTMFADYRVPQVLVYFGVLGYKDELKKKLQSELLLENGSEEELEIRGCSIEAVEQVKDVVKEIIKSKNLSPLCNSVIIDYYLWTYRREHRKELESIPFHKVKSIYY